jgi:dipicolinate synthase subunit A
MQAGEITLVHHKFAVLGGDKRNIYLYKLLEEDGHIVRKFGFDAYDLEPVPESANLYDAVNGADYIIGPTPFSNNCTSLNAVYSSVPILTDDIFRLVKPNQTFFSGHIKDAALASAKKYGVTCIDILNWEELALLNAIPTAEGAIKIAMENTDFTLHGSRSMVVGYGRIGKVLCKMLNGMGAKVYPVVKMRCEAAAARGYGYSPILHAEMNAELHSMDIIFNTVPRILFDKKNIKYINKKCLFIDLSSAPHGINNNFAKEAGLNVLFAGSLPGAVAPKTAAKYIQETIYGYLEKERGGGNGV